MAGLSLRQAAQEAGTSKSSIARAIASGRMSATRTDGGGWAIEPAELFRVFPQGGPAPRTGTAQQGQTVPPSRDALETEIRMLRDRIEEMRQELVRAHETALKALERPLMLPPPETPQRRGFWLWRRAG